MTRRAAPPTEGPTTVRRVGLVDAPLVVEALPREVPFGFLGTLLPSREPIELRLQLHPLARDRALELLRRAGAVAESELVAPDNGHGSAPATLEAEAESAAELGRRVAEREQELFRVGLSFHALDRDVRRAERRRTDLIGRARAIGLRLRRPLHQAAPAADAPALDASEPRPPGYWHTLHTDGVAAFFPFIEEAVVEPGGVLTGLLLHDAAPVFLDRFAHASFSWGVFGSTGSGKSFFAALTGLRTRWQRPDLDLVFVDPLGEFGGFATALGGSVISLARDGSARLNPLDPRTTGGDGEEKAARVSAFLRALFPSLLDEEAATLESALERLFQRGGEPTFGDLADAVVGSPASGRLPALLEVFRTGPLHHLNGPTTAVWGAGPIALDLSAASDTQLAFHLAYVLDAVLGRLRRRPGPKLVVVDEAHLLARDPPTAAFLDRLVRHVRHYDAGLLLLSQNPDDFLRHENGRSLLRNLRATLLLRLPEVSPAARDFFRLTEAEAEWLGHARLPREAGYAEGLLRHGAAHLPLALIASTPEYELLVGALGARAAGAPRG